MEEVIKVDDCGDSIGDYDIPIYNAIIVPINATNGDVIKAIFPNVSYQEGFVYIETDGKKNLLMTVNEDWWNAPYKESNE